MQMNYRQREIIDMGYFGRQMETKISKETQSLKTTISQYLI